MIDLLSLENFKAIKNNDFKFSKLTLFSGINGIGKSTVLQSLLLLRQTYEKNNFNSDGLILNSDYVKMGVGKDILYVNAEKDIVLEKEIIKIKVLWATENSIDLYFNYDESSDVQSKNEISKIDKNSFSESLFTSNFQYLSAERINPSSTYSASEFVVKQKRSLGVKGEYTAHFLAENGNSKITLEALKHTSSKSSLLIDNINAWMSEISPGTKVIAKKIPEINQATLHYQISASDLIYTIKPENTGFGLTYVLPVVTAIISAKPGDLLIIENPESHLHSSAQSVIAKMIALASESNVQIIVETHSDHFLNGIRLAVKNCDIKKDNVKIYYLSKSTDLSENSVEIEEIEIDSDGRVNKWPKGFFDEWDVSLDKLLT
jgi:predicted ATPase